MAEIENDPDLMNLEPELAYLKALAEQLALNYQKLEAALLAWHRAETPVYQKLIETNDPIEIRDALVELRRIEPPRPAELPDAPNARLEWAWIAASADRVGRSPSCREWGRMP